jgi:predicted neuraminidase
MKKFIFDEKSAYFSTLALLPNRDVVVAWFGGTKEGHPDQAIWQSIRRESQWSKPVCVADTEGLPHWNPVLFFEHGILYLFYRTGHTTPEWRSWVKHSKDGGRTYTQVEALPEGILGPIKNKPICMSNGKWLCGSSLETTDGEFTCWFNIFSKKERTWASIGPIKAEIEPDSIYAKDNIGGIIQPTVWESKQGYVHALLRSTMDWIYRVDSEDFGRTWTKPYRTQIPNPSSGIDLAKLNDGTLILACNPCHWDRDNYYWGPRTPLTLFLSEDNGQTWPYYKNIEDGKVPRVGGFAYPSIIPVPEGVAVVYTWKEKRVCYCVFSPNRIRGKERLC